MNKNNINLNELMENDIAIWCDTKEKALDLFSYFKEQGCQWISGETSLSKLHWESYHEETCYDVDSDKCISFCDKDWYEGDDYEVVQWEIVKNDVQMEDVGVFDLDKFAKGDLCIEFSSEEEFKEIISKLELLGYSENFNAYYGEGRALRYNQGAEGLDSCNAKTYSDWKKEVIKWDDSTKIYTTGEMICAFEKDPTLKFNCLMELDGEYESVLISDGRVCWDGDNLYPMFVVVDKDRLLWVLSPKEQTYKVYKVEHCPNGRLYTFRSDDVIPVGALVDCETAIGNSYGFVREVSNIKMSDGKYRSYRKCTELRG